MIIKKFISTKKRAYQEDLSVLLYHMYFQVIKINCFYKTVRSKAGFVMPLEISNIGIEPDWFSEIKLAAYSLNCIKHLVRARLEPVVADDSVP